MLGPVTFINFFLSVVDVVTNYVFIRVFDWKIVGAPLGINAAFLVGLTIAVLMLLRRSTAPLYTLKPWRKIPPKAEWSVFVRDSFNLMSRSILVELSAFLVPLFVGRLPGSIPSAALGQVVLELSKYSIFIPQCFGSCANILGSYYLAQGEVSRFLKLRNIVMILGVGTGCLLGLCYFFLFDQFVNLFVGVDDREAVRAILSPYLLPFVLIQPFLAMSEVCDGLMYATKWFTYLRNVVISGFFLIFLPLLFLGVYLFDNWFGIWVSMSAFTVFRFLCLFPRIIRARNSELAKLASSSALAAVSDEEREMRSAYNLQETSLDRTPILHASEVEDLPYE